MDLIFFLFVYGSITLSYTQALPEPLDGAEQARKLERTPELDTSYICYSRTRKLNYLCFGFQTSLAPLATTDHRISIQRAHHTHSLTGYSPTLLVALDRCFLMVARINIHSPV